MTYLPHSLLERARWFKALRYAQCLTPGDEIIESIDGDYIESFKGMLPLALEVHGLRLIGTVIHKLEVAA